jgi:hypothetical protein
MTGLFCFQLPEKGMSVLIQSFLFQSAWVLCCLGLAVGRLIGCISR